MKTILIVLFLLVVFLTGCVRFPNDPKWDCSIICTYKTGEFVPAIEKHGMCYCRGTVYGPGAIEETWTLNGIDGAFCCVPDCHTQAERIRALDGK